MDNLEKFIKENRANLDQKSPSKELWSKISEQRESEAKTKVVPMRMGYKIMKVAAGLLILALAAFGVYNLIPNDSTVAVEQSEPRLPIEVMEMDQYYERQVASYVVQVEQVIDDAEILEDIKNDLELLNQEKSHLMGEFRDEIDNQELMEALVATYRMKLQVLENILGMINEENHEDQKSI
ncbi:MAG: hypothetical protein JXR19_07550 [Bacteroidia bacterium]